MKALKWKELENVDLKGKVFVIPTDTIYGFSALWGDEEALEKIYQIKQRDKNKKLIVLIEKIEDLDRFEIELDQNHKNILERLWPDRVSIILKNNEGEEIAFRIPAKKELREFVKKVGPIYSTSYNISGQPAEKDLKNIDKFPLVDYFINEGELKNPPSIIFKLIR